MRKYFLSLVAMAAMILFSGCNKNEDFYISENGDMVTFNIATPEMGTRAFSDGTTANKLIVAVYQGGQYREALTQNVTINGSAQVSLPLVTGVTYDIVFWAQAEGAPYTFTPSTGIVSVDYTDVTANNENLDAFYANRLAYKVEGPKTETVNLTRPFAQLNVATLDYELAKNSGIDITETGIVVEGVYTSFNLKTQDGAIDANSATTITLSRYATPKEQSQVLSGYETYSWLSMNYLLVNEKTTVRAKMATNNGNVVREWFNIPVQRNYRTNILGNILTTTTDFNVVIDEDFAGEYEEEYIRPGIKIVEGGFEINSAEGLWNFAAVLNSTTKSVSPDTFKDKTIKLGSDIDLENKAWTPIKKFTGKFDGNNYTIKNLNVNAYKGGIFEHVVGPISNLRVDGATIVATRQAAAIVGSIYGNVTNCSVNNATISVTPEWLEDEQVYDNGDKAGAIIGLLCEGGYTFSRNKATNITISAFRDLGGLIGCAHTSTITGNEVNNINLIIDKTYSYGKYENHNAGPILGSDRQGQSTLADNIIGEYSVGVIEPTADGIQQQIQNAKSGDVVAIPAGNYETLPTPNEQITILCQPGTIFQGTSSLNIKGSTVIGATFENENGSSVSSTINGVFENCTFTGSNALYYCYAGENVIFRNCVFDGVTYGVHFDAGANDVTFENCVFSGFNAFGGALTQLNLIDCTFKPLGNSSYNGINMWGNTKLENCNFEFDGAHTEWIDACNDGKILEFNGCEVNGEPLSIDRVGDYGEGNIIIIDGKWYVSTAATLTEALGKGVSVILNADIDLGSNILTLDKGQTLDLGGKTLTQSGSNRGVILKNGASLKNGVINHSGVVAAVCAWNIESIENVTINLETPASGTVTGIAVQQYSTVGTIKDVTVQGVGVTQAIEVPYQATVNLIENVTVDNSAATNGVALVINGGKVGKAKDCTFKGNVYGVTMHLKGVFAVGLELEKCAVEGNTASIYAWDEKDVSNTSGSLTLTYDAETTLTGPFVWDFEDECKSVVTLNRPQ